MKVNNLKTELLKGYLLMSIVLFPLLIAQSWLASDASNTRYNIISINSYLTITAYSACFLGLCIEKRRIESAIRALIYTSAAAIIPYVIFLNISLMYLYTNSSECELVKKSIGLNTIIYLIFGIFILIKIKNENIKNKIIKNEFHIKRKIIMNNPYKKDYWKKSKNSATYVIPMISSVIPFVFFIKNTQKELTTNVYAMSLIGAPLSMYIFLILTKSIYMYFFVPIYLSIKEGKKITFDDEHDE